MLLPTHSKGLRASLPKLNVWIDPHHQQRRLERVLERINALNHNRELFLRFERFMRVEEELSITRIERVFVNLLKIDKWMKKDFFKANKEDIIKVLEMIHSKNYSPFTSQTYKTIIKKLFRWLGKAEIVDWIPYTLKSDVKQPEELITRRELYALIHITDNIKHKALIYVLYESALRISELLSLKIKNVVFDKYGAVLLVNGKTGSRRVRIIESVKLLKEWLFLNPFRRNPESPVWFDRGRFLSYSSFRKILRRIVEKAKINKRIYPQLFRHSRATELANHLTEPQLKEFLGWSPHSRMPSLYVHLSGRDVDRAILRLYIKI